MKLKLNPRALLAILTFGHVAAAQPFELGIVAFQTSSETHARVANAAAEAARRRGWNVVALNSEGSLSQHAQQIESLVERRVDGIVLAMSKPVEFDVQMRKAKEAGIPLITVMTGLSPHALFDIQVNEYAVGTKVALYLLDQIGHEGAILTSRFENNSGTRIRGKILDVVLSETPAIKVAGSHTMVRTQDWQADVREGIRPIIHQHTGNFKGVWASFDGQAFIIDDLLKEQGLKKADVALVSVDGGAEAFRRIKSPDSLMTATVAIPFETMGTTAVKAMERIAAKGEPKEAVVPGPILYLDADLVDSLNVDRVLKR